jgi:hypothetical protein
VAVLQQAPGQAGVNQLRLHQMQSTCTGWQECNVAHGFADGTLDGNPTWSLTPRLELLDNLGAAVSLHRCSSTSYRHLMLT